MFFIVFYRGWRIHSRCTSTVLEFILNWFILHILKCWCCLLNEFNWLSFHNRLLIYLIMVLLNNFFKTSSISRNIFSLMSFKLIKLIIIFPFLLIICLTIWTFIIFINNFKKFRLTIFHSFNWYFILFWFFSF